MENTNEKSLQYQKKKKKTNLEQNKQKEIPTKYFIVKLQKLKLQEIVTTAI